MNRYLEKIAQKKEEEGSLSEEVKKEIAQEAVQEMPLPERSRRRKGLGRKALLVRQALSGKISVH